MNKNNTKKTLTQQDFPRIQGAKNLTEKQKDEILESHEFIRGGKVIMDGSAEFGGTILG